MLTQELREYYDAQFDMMSSKGWKDLCDDLKGIKDGLSDIQKATVETLTNRQGRLAEIDFILTRRDILSKAFTELEENDATPI